MIMSIILAAGEGSRMKSKTPKGLHKICGKPLVGCVVEAARKAHTSKNYVVIGHGSEKIKDEINEKDVEFLTQPIGDDVPYGTGFAVMQAKDYIEDDSYVIILYGDTPLIKSETINDLLYYHKKGGFVATVLTAEFEDPTGYGRIIRNKEGYVVNIVEQKDANEEQLKIKEINSGIYFFKGKYLREVLGKLNSDNAQGEYMITDAIKILNDEGHNIGAYKMNDNSELSGINTRVQLAEAENVMRKRINEKLMLEGVTIIDPERTYIEDKVKVGRDTIIYPGAILEGNTEIGEDCVIGQNCRIRNSKVGNEVEIQSSTLLKSRVGNGTKIGPYAYLRPNSEIGDNVKIGDFVEVKNSIIGSNSKASHLAYIGDADVGKNVNIGCGVVFVNYDGKNKHRTIIEDNAFVGSNSNLVAPVVVRENGYIAAGSTITNEVDRDSLSIARARQVNKEGWVKKKKLLKSEE